MRKPDLTIDGGNGPQTLRWHLFPTGWQFALHKWLQSDHDRALHDHVADNVSIILWGCYREVFSHAWEPRRAKHRWPLIPYFRKAEVPHRVELCDSRPVWTLWIRWPSRRQWGFYCEKRGWVHWKQYIAETDYEKTGTSTIGRGCDE